MGTYFNPPEELPQVGRSLAGETYDELVAQLRAGEKLFGHYRRSLFQNAVYLFSAEELEAFESQVRMGVIRRLGFYAMPEDIFRERVVP